jgi:hypothetical protein
LSIHLNGIGISIVDKYSGNITDLDQTLVRKSITSMIGEIVRDLVSTIKANDPPLPDMNEVENFKFFFRLNNKDYK